MTSTINQEISIVIITLNEEKNIERCLKSVQWAGEIVIVDSGSVDRTIEICRKYTDKIFEVEWMGFGLTKKFAVDAAKNDWIFSIDSDEEVTVELKRKIQEILKDPSVNGYNVKRKSFYLGKMIHHCGWDRDYPVRLFNRKHGNFNDKSVHESVKIEGEKHKIHEPMLHYTYPTIHSHIEKINRYTDLSADQLFEKGKSCSLIAALARGFVKFVKMYLLQKGFLDGKLGFILSYNSAYGVYLKYLKVCQKNQ